MLVYTTALLASALLSNALGVNQIKNDRKDAKAMRAKIQSSLVTRAEKQMPPIYTFKQKVNHFPEDPAYAYKEDHHFDQRFIVDTTHYKPGGFIIFNDAAESELTREVIQGEYYFLTQFSLTLAKELNAAIVAVEMRGYGATFPTKDLSTDNLRLYTIEQTLADSAYFAAHVKIPGLEHLAPAPHTPWIYYGGSYSGATTGFIMKTYPHIFYGGIASSGVVHAESYYAGYYEHLYKHAEPQECMQKIAALTELVDELAEKAPEQMPAFKKLFGMESITKLPDFTGAIAWPLGFWQSVKSEGPSSRTFPEFCGNITDKPTAKEVELDTMFSKYTSGKTWHGLGLWVRFINAWAPNFCDVKDYNTGACFANTDRKFNQNITISEDTMRAYMYVSCTEFGAFQTNAPVGQPTLISRSINEAYWAEFCAESFPPGKINSIPEKADVSRWNKYGDYELSADRLAFISGARDPWRGLCVQSETAPPRPNTLLRPSILMPHGIHCWDYRSNSDDYHEEPAELQTTHEQIITAVRSWMRDFKEWKPTPPSA
ncbi:uncharacterized protein L969DRAFT_17518 [Mixia osmundae IAM 14324]|uniref:Serine carboxypeptidase S28 n=1 Tax=Mixia osmundae (strain CBS 9802 / IAM 14324 / JCM 22182 / KY 12970) TaxID=764103 RepID=G7DVW4_MIXOS|nr:uncharacterized protein L969DRAFT_17518 [Mixia osmundae IAM 14324]KEI39597.1 hypothetical protein L969DRAFT_17518 [Mixia osmundae IAM 14324]GAA94724.1 hypothetical protein E5Q_01377 [Mixia osmundae IAM 14324]